MYFTTREANVGNGKIPGRTLDLYAEHVVVVEIINIWLTLYDRLS